MTYAFHTPDKLCFILDLMNGGDLHYHLSQHGVFNESDMKFYAAEVSCLDGFIHFLLFVFRFVLVAVVVFGWRDKGGEKCRIGS